jgi:hypothetical protein
VPPLDRVEIDAGALRYSHPPSMRGWGPKFHSLARRNSVGRKIFEVPTSPYNDDNPGLSGSACAIAPRRCPREAVLCGYLGVPLLH